MTILSVYNFHANATCVVLNDECYYILKVILKQGERINSKAS